MILNSQIMVFILNIFIATIFARHEPWISGFLLFLMFDDLKVTIFARS